MSIWLFRAGKHGEYEAKFLSDKKIYLTWNQLNVDLRLFQTKEALLAHLSKLYPEEKEKTLINWMSQIWPIAHTVNIGDWIILPSKMSRTIHIGKITGDYTYHPNHVDPYYHSRDVDWFAQDIPRERFDQDILYSLGAFLTVCRIKKNDAENRIKKMAQNNWVVSPSKKITLESDDDATTIDIEELINDQISNLIIQRFKGNRMEDLVNELLKAKGFNTYRSAEGADHGVDILASSGTLGFGSPKICVQVKTSDTPIDRPTLDQLIGTMSNYNADYGLLVSWSGFKASVIKEVPKHFFNVRLWDAQTILNEIYSNYDKLSDDIRVEIPLKRVWLLSDQNNSIE